MPGSALGAISFMTFPFVSWRIPFCLAVWHHDGFATVSPFYLEYMAGFRILDVYLGTIAPQCFV